MIVLGLDSATRTGFAVVRVEGGREELLEHGVIDGRDADEIDDFAHRIAQTYSPDVAAIEDNYLDKDPSALKTLSRIVGRWQQALETRGVETRLVLAQVWQSGLLRGLGGAGDRKGRKKAAALWVLGAFRIKDVSPDETDAICMATWEARRRAFAGKVDAAGRAS
jgi:Holliday junction resolvasome RuvABC endonuclease subunit